ncbi:MAG: ThuA domain-containing protein [Verrucomicrobiales bacterium]|nr:ThuA domain-containing protein [Verrucomicrobiales bacterium]
MVKKFLLCVAAILVPFGAFGDESKVLKLKGGEGPGKGKKIVLIAGDEEYRTEESMPMLAKILSGHHGFDCVVVFSWDKGGKFIDPNNQKGLVGLSELEGADLMIIGTRFRNPDAEQAKYIVEYLNYGQPVIGIRTATHAFKGDEKFGKIPYGKWGREILGEQWVSHHGKHKVEGTRGVPDLENSIHPLLSGVSDVFGPSDVYGVKNLTEDDTVLLRGAVTADLTPDSPSVAGPKNNPMQAMAWLHEYVAPNGVATGQSFCTTMGASVDLVNPGLRRLLVNAACYLTGIDIPAEAEVGFVDPFYPSFYGFVRQEGWYEKLDYQPQDFGLGKTPHSPDPPGSPEWDFRDKPAE